MVINGGTWATRNVDMPGTFAATGNDAGMFYQWNRPTAWSITDPRKAYNADGEIVGATWNTNTDNGTSWLPENDPSPVGWRVPTRAELDALLDAKKVSSEWVAATEITPAGRKFTDIVTGNSIFFPTVGSRDATSGNPFYNNTNGYYWLSSLGVLNRNKPVLNFLESVVRILDGAVWALFSIMIILFAA